MRGEMTDDQMRIAIAEACPQVFHRPTGHAGWNYFNSYVKRVLPCIDGDPLSDLNAMHYAEKTLTDDEYEQYFETLPKVLGLDPFFKVESERAMLSSSARQRAEAFLRVKGLWKEQSQS